MILLIRVFRIFAVRFNPGDARTQKRCIFALGCSNLVFSVSEKGSVSPTKLQFPAGLITTSIFFERLHEYSI
jgi:hypothetical protein